MTTSLRNVAFYGHGGREISERPVPDRQARLLSQTLLRDPYSYAVDNPFSEDVTWFFDAIGPDRPDMQELTGISNSLLAEGDVVVPGLVVALGSLLDADGRIDSSVYDHKFSKSALIRIISQLGDLNTPNRPVYISNPGEEGRLVTSAGGVQMHTGDTGPSWLSIPTTHSRKNRTLELPIEELRSGNMLANNVGGLVTGIYALNAIGTSSQSYLRTLPDFNLGTDELADKAVWENFRPNARLALDIATSNWRVADVYDHKITDSQVEAARYGIAASVYYNLRESKIIGEEAGLLAMVRPLCDTADEATELAIDIVADGLVSRAVGRYEVLDPERFGRVAGPYFRVIGAMLDGAEDLWSTGGNFAQPEATRSYMKAVGYVSLSIAKKLE